MIDADQSSIRLVTTGIFSYCRHPIYAGQILMTIGTVCIANNWWCSILPVGTTLYCVWRAWREDQDLLQRFNGEFTRYRDRTSFIVPWLAGKRDDE